MHKVAGLFNLELSCSVTGGYGYIVFEVIVRNSSLFTNLPEKSQYIYKSFSLKTDINSDFQFSHIVIKKVKKQFIGDPSGEGHICACLALPIRNQTEVSLLLQSGHIGVPGHSLQRPNCCHPTLFPRSHERRLPCLLLTYNCSNRVMHKAGQ
jgi:hypothetical protein